MNDEQMRKALNSLMKDVFRVENYVVEMSDAARVDDMPKSVIEKTTAYEKAFGAFSTKVADAVKRAASTVVDSGTLRSIDQTFALTLVAARDARKVAEAEAALTQYTHLKRDLKEFVSRTNKMVKVLQSLSRDVEKICD